MQHQWFLADTHFGQGESILRHRPQFTTVEQHDRHIVNNINAVVNPSDTLVLLGDVGLSDRAMGSLESIRCRKIILTPGNHDGERCRIHHEYYDSVTGAFVTRINKVYGVCTHIPIHPQCLDRWEFNIHGHLHDGTIDDPRYVCVSCEQTNFRPLNKSQIRQLLIARGVLKGDLTW